MPACRGKIGFIMPAGDTGGLDEHFALLPEGVNMIVSNCGVSKLIPVDLEKAFLAYPAAAKHMAEQECDIILMAGSLVFTYMGERAQQMIKQIKESVKVPIIVNLDAHFDALRAIGAKSIVIATPYEEPRTEERKKLCESVGFKVLNTASLSLQKRWEIQQLSPWASYRAAKKAFFGAPEEPDAIYISCPEWPTIEMIEELEQDTGKPVVTPAVAEVWACLKAMKIRDHICGYGQLLEQLS